MDRIAIKRLLAKIVPAVVVIFLLVIGTADIDRFFSYVESGKYENKASALVAILENPPTPYLPVQKVVDGDTIEVYVDGGIATVRLIGINTPETLDPRKPVECFGPEASEEARKILENQSVRLELDPTQDTYDKYGRVLAYVFFKDGTIYNEHMITNGFAKEYTYQKKYKYQKEFRAAQKAAKHSGLGMWGECD